MKFPSFLQPDAMDCGATCLRMIAKFYGKDYTLETLREKCYTTREGVSLLSISETAEQIGFKTVGGKLTFEKLVKEAPLPCIIHWNQEHFVVVYKVKEKNIFGKYIKIFVADPAFGLVSYNEDEFTKFG
ncbi:MAG TPA: cysteine peptidase family C39 domain-containing protein [Bacteroidales bacterium]|nr:cysteine peptidase family C39 domain-containing protein [Bacteroidales bacterium]